MTRTALLLTLATAAFAAIPEPVRIETGQITGVAGRDPSVRVFKGIPYAAPPTGVNRWRAPQPAAKWDGVRAADAFGPNCIANAGAAGKGGPGKGNAKGGVAASAPSSARGPAPSEDCLYINVWTAAESARERRPVIVWTYGGGFTGGSGAEARYDGESLARKGAVVVTYNYRLGVFGFFAHPELSKESGKNASGNYGMMDLVAALRWVRNNIAAFGGDPNRVTIAGESAGSIMIAALAASPQGKGLFHRVIGQSGGWMSPGVGPMRKLAEAEQAGLRAANGRSIAGLRAASLADLNLTVQAGLLVDGYMIPEDPTTTFRAGKQLPVEVLVGANRDEGTFFGGRNTAESVQTQARQRFGDMADEFFALYPSSTDEQAAASAIRRQTDEFVWHMRTWARLNAAQGKKSYVYYFTRVAPGQEARGATHTAELTYMFNNPPANNRWTDLDHKLADVMTSYWVNFAAKGDPNGPGLPQWPAYDAKKNDGQAMVLGDTVAFGAQMEATRLAFWDKFFARLE